MDIATTLFAVLFSFALAGATFGACHIWYGKRMREALARMEKVELSRQTATQHALQARRQIEALQKELTALREGGPAAAAVAAAEATAKRREAVEATLAQEAAARGFAAGRMPTDGFPQTQIDPARPATAFADTLPMCVRPPMTTT